MCRQPIKEKTNEKFLQDPAFDFLRHERIRADHGACNHGPGVRRSHRGTKPQVEDSDHYTLTFLNADFALSRDRSNIRDQAESLIIFVADPLGKIVKDAQVVTTIVGPHGDQLMRRAHPYKGGYVINTKALPPGMYRVETEIATNGWLLTDEFNFCERDKGRGWGRVRRRKLGTRGWGLDEKRG